MAPIPTVQMLGPGGGCVHISGTDYKPTGGVYTIPQNLVPQAEAAGLVIITTKAASGAPTVNDIPASVSMVWKNTGDGTVKLYYNDGGTLKSVALA